MSAKAVGVVHGVRSALGRMQKMFGRNERTAQMLGWASFFPVPVAIAASLWSLFDRYLEMSFGAWVGAVVLIAGVLCTLYAACKRDVRYQLLGGGGVFAGVVIGGWQIGVIVIGESTAVLMGALLGAAVHQRLTLRWHG